MAIFKKTNIFNFMDFLSNKIYSVRWGPINFFLFSLQYYYLEALHQETTPWRRTTNPPLTTKVSFVRFYPAYQQLPGHNHKGQDSYKLVDWKQQF